MTRLCDCPDRWHNKHDSARIGACAGGPDRETTVRTFPARRPRQPLVEGLDVVAMQVAAP
jgi:hypothetical protein